MKEKEVWKCKNRFWELSCLDKICDPENLTVLLQPHE